MCAEFICQSVCCYLSIHVSQQTLGWGVAVGETNSRPEAGNKTPIRPSKLSKNSNSSDVIFSIPQELVNGGMEAGRKKEGGVQ